MSEIQQKNNQFLSWESFWLGGFSIILALGFWAFVDKSSSLYTVSMLAFSLAFIVNHPHFLSSYLLLYSDHRQSIFKNIRFIWAAVVVPLLLISILVYSYTNKSLGTMAWLITSMYFFVGWHYVKQIFGCVIVTNAQRKIFFSALTRKLVLINLFSVWFMSWLRTQVGDQSFAFYGIAHKSVNLPTWTLTAIYYIVGISLMALLVQLVREYIQRGFVPCASSITAFASIYAWYIPTFSHPSYGYLIPFFHSLQYLYLVWILKKNQTQAAIQDLQPVEKRRQWVIRFIGFFMAATFLGALCFEFIPKYLDGSELFNAREFTASFYIASFLLFINIHHYFIDNVIWRSQNTEVKKYLFLN